MNFGTNWGEPSCSSPSVSLYRRLHQCQCACIIVWRLSFVLFCFVIACQGPRFHPQFPCPSCPRPWACSGRLRSIGGTEWPSGPESLVSCCSEDSVWLVSISAECRTRVQWAQTAARGIWVKPRKDFPNCKSSDTVSWGILGDGGIISPRKFLKLKEKYLTQRSGWPIQNQRTRRWERGLWRLALFKTDWNILVKMVCAVVSLP